MDVSCKGMGGYYLRLRPLAVVDHLTRAGPVFLRASCLVILDATLLGLQAGYGRLVLPLADFRPQASPVLTSVHCSPNHLPNPPRLLDFAAMMNYLTLLLPPDHLPPLALYCFAAHAFA